MNQYDEKMKQKIENMCSSMFLESIDFELTSPDNAIKAYDMLYNIYCKKF